MFTMRNLYYLLSPKLRRFIRRVYFLPQDIWHSFTRKKEPLTPPKGKIFTGGGDFLKDGQKFVKQFENYGNLRPDHRVLDIGCGIGRVAVPLTGYLNQSGSYEGFDVVKEGIDWCQKKIQPLYPAFNFHYIPLKNDLYNLATDRDASNLVFPFSDREFDFIASISVFTHMLPGETDNYFKEIKRVAKPGGTCFATFFILTNEREKKFDRGELGFFNYSKSLNKGRYFKHHQKVATANVGYQEFWIDKKLREHDLAIKAFYPGWWAKDQDKQQALDFQDVLIITS